MEIADILQQAKSKKGSRNLYDVSSSNTMNEVINSANVKHFSKSKPSLSTTTGREDQCFIIIPDVHAHDRDVPAYELVMEHALPALNKAYNVTKVVQLGDLMDVAELTSHPPSHVNEEIPKYEDELNWAIEDFWVRVQDKCPKAEYHALMGNHENRINKYVTRYSKKEFAKYIHETLNPTKVYESMGIQVTPYGSETAADNMLQLFPGLFCVHGWSFSTHAAATHLNKLGRSASILFGHTHRIDSCIAPTAGTGKQVGAWSFGALQKKNRYYNGGTPNDHALGFGIVLTHGDMFSVYTIQIHGNEGTTHRHCILPDGTVLETK
jgi:predicted phosphodiesterase